MSNVALDEAAKSFVEGFSGGVDRLKLNYSIPLLNPSSHENAVDRSLRQKFANIRDVNNLVMKFNIDKGPGADSIRCKDIKRYAADIAPALLTLINVSISSGISTDNLKLGMIRPNYKKRRS